MTLTRLSRATATLTLCVALAACSSPDPATPSASPNPAPSTSPSANPLAPGEMPPRLVGADDAALLAAAENPRTGEVWLTEPDGLEPAVPILADDMADQAFPVHVGHRGDAEIFLVVEVWQVYGGGNNAWGLFEVRNGTAYQIYCPLATQSTCAPPDASDSANVSSSLANGVQFDVETFYDSLTLPETLTIGSGFPYSTPAIVWTDDYGYRSDYGGAWHSIAQVPSTLVGPPSDWAAPADLEYNDLATFGQWRLVSYEEEGASPDLPNVFLLLISPFGTSYLGGSLASSDITWLDGFAPVPPNDEFTLAEAYEAPWRNPCGGFPTFGLDTNHQASGWRVGGTLPTGQAVYVPIAGGNDLSEDRWAAYWNDGEPGPNQDISELVLTTEQAFLDINALISVEGSAGDWWVLVAYGATPNGGYGCY